MHTSLHPAPRYKGHSRLVSPSPSVLYIRSLRVQTNKQTDRQTNKQPPKHTSTQSSPHHLFIPATSNSAESRSRPQSRSRAPADVARAASVRGGGACSVRWAVRASLASWLGSGAVGMPKREMLLCSRGLVSRVVSEEGRGRRVLEGRRGEVG
jgi:hypothetical protein